MYPIVVFLLVEKNRSLNSEFCSFGTMSDVPGDQPPPMSFASGPTAAGQIDSAMNSRNINIHVTFETVSEPGDAGMLRSKNA